MKTIKIYARHCAINGENQTFFSYTYFSYFSSLLLHGPIHTKEKKRQRERGALSLSFLASYLCLLRTPFNTKCECVSTVFPTERFDDRGKSREENCV